MATTTDAVAEGTNLYFTNARFDTRFITDLAATSSVNAITTLLNLSLPATQLTSFGTPFYNFFSATTTSALSEGSNLYFTNTRFDNRLSATTTLPNLTTLANLVTTGALTSGSIGSGFGNVNIGANTFTGNGSGLTSLNANNLANFGTPFYTYFSATTTDALTQGSTNKYYSDTSVNSYIHASSTIPKTYTTNTFTGANTFSGALTFDALNGPLQANGGLVSATTSIGVLYGGTGLTSTPSYGQILRGTGTGYTLVATSTLGVDVSDTVGTLTVARGGTGATSFGQGWLSSSGDGNVLTASTSPTVNYITATSTTATSTFAGGISANLLSITSTTATSTFANGINLTGGCFKMNGACIGITSDLQYVTSNSTNDTLTNITSATTTLTTVSITPTTATGDIVVRAGVTFTSGSNTDQPISIAIRQTNCTGTTLQSTLFTTAAAANSFQYQHLDLNYVAVDPGASSQTYAFCISASAGNTNVSDWNMSAIVIDTGADVAEIYTTNDASLEAGDVVSLDPTLKTGVKKSTDASDRTVLGIVSTKPAMVIGGVEKEGVKAIPIALSGRVPVKVATENGVIMPGDYLTPSSQSGVAMKSKGLGPVIGQAMSAYSGAGVGMVMVFVKNFDLSAIEQTAVLMGDISPKVNADGSDNGLSTLVASIQSETAHNPVAIIAKKIADGKQFLTDFITARVTAIRGYFDEVFAKKVHTDELCVKKSDSNEVCVGGDQLNSLLSTFGGSASGGQNASVAPAVNPVPSNNPAPTNNSGTTSSVTPEPTPQPSPDATAGTVAPAEAVAIPESTSPAIPEPPVSPAAVEVQP